MEGSVKDAIGRVRRGLERVSRPLSEALDVERRVRKIGALLFEIHEASKTEPGGPGGVEAAARIFRAMAELGQEIPILGGAVGAYLEFLKLPETIIEFRRRVWELRTPEERERGLRETTF